MDFDVLGYWIDEAKHEIKNIAESAYAHDPKFYPIYTQPLLISDGNLLSGLVDELELARKAARECDETNYLRSLASFLIMQEQLELTPLSQFSGGRLNIPMEVASAYASEFHDRCEVRKK